MYRIIAIFVSNAATRSSWSSTSG